MVIARAALSGALLTATWLWGGLALGIVAANVLTAPFPDGIPAVDLSLGLAPATAGIFVGGAIWGSRMGRLGSSHETARMRWAGVLGFGVVTLALGVLLFFVEARLPAPAVLSNGRFPVHRIFTLLFVPTSFLVVAAASLSLAIGLRRPGEGVTLACRAGLAAAGSFLVVDLLMEAGGWQVGGPGAAERYTMLVVTSAGALGSALAGGAVIGSVLTRS